jgi:nucleoside-diphosphate-sugar epimerase
MEGCETVIHAAAVLRAWNYQEFENVNRFGTDNLAKAAAECVTPPVFVYVSSLAAAGNSKPNLPKRESDPALPISKYGKSKWAGETALMQFAGQMPCTVVRPCIVFGEADKMNLEIFKLIKNWGFCPIPGWGEKFYSWIHATDLSDLLIAAAQKGERLGQDQPSGTAPGMGVYFASSDAGRKLSDIARMIGHSLGRDRVRMVPCPPVPSLVVSTYYEAKKWCTGKTQPLDWGKAWEALHHWTCSPEKAQSQLNFSPQPLEERINQTAQWFVENGWL